MSQAAKPKRRWYQYSLRTLLVLMALVSVAMSWLVARCRRGRQCAAVQAIQHLGGLVLYDYQVDVGRDPRRRTAAIRLVHALAGDDLLRSAALVDFSGNTRLTDADLQQLKSLPGLRILDLGGTQITDAGLQNLAGLAQLQDLRLDGTRITDAGLKHLRGLGRLERLSLIGTGVTDAGLEQLKGLSRLREIWTNGPNVSEQVQQKLRESCPGVKVMHF